MYAKVNKKHHTWAIIQEEKHVQIILTCKQNVYTLHSQKMLAKGRRRRKVKLKERKEKKMLERYVWNTGALEKLRMPKKILPP